MEPIATSYSIEQLIRYAFEYEVANHLNVQQLAISEEIKDQIIKYLESRISEIKNKKIF